MADDFDLSGIGTFKEVRREDFNFAVADPTTLNEHDLIRLANPCAPNSTETADERADNTHNGGPT
jgi:hypothetical protein